jgi:hypothetical protein
VLRRLGHQGLDKSERWRGITARPRDHTGSFCPPGRTGGLSPPHLESHHHNNNAGQASCRASAALPAKDCQGPGQVVGIPGHGPSRRPTSRTAGGSKLLLGLQRIACRAGSAYDRNQDRARGGRRERGPAQAVPGDDPRRARRLRARDDRLAAPRPASQRVAPGAGTRATPAGCHARSDVGQRSVGLGVLVSSPGRPGWPGCADPFSGLPGSGAACCTGAGPGRAFRLSAHVWPSFFMIVGLLRLEL